jgi:hypothetical protein
VFGVTPHQLRIQVRLSRAQELLGGGRSIPMGGPYRWITVVSPGERDAARGEPLYQPA